jgi:transcriptional regulator GlxA family with amidase domain
MQNLRLMAWLKRAAQLARVVAGISSGVFLLAAAHLMDDKAIAPVLGVSDSFPGVRPVEGEAIVSDGKMVTATDFRFSTKLGVEIVRMTYGTVAADHVSRQLDEDFRMMDSNDHNSQYLR